MLPCRGAPVPSVRASSEGGLSGCFAEGVTSNTSDSESSSSKCVSRLLSHLCARVCMCVHVLALPSCLVLVVVLFGGWSFLLVTLEMLRPVPSSGLGGAGAGGQEQACLLPCSLLAAGLCSRAGWWVSSPWWSPILGACCKKQWPEAGSVAYVAPGNQACTRAWGSSCSKCSLYPQWVL